MLENINPNNRGKNVLAVVERDVHFNMKEKAQNIIQEHRGHLPVNLTMGGRQVEMKEI